MVENDWFQVFFQLKSTICKLSQETGHQGLKSSGKDSKREYILQCYPHWKNTETEAYQTISHDSLQRKKNIDISCMPKNTSVAHSWSHCSVCRAFFFFYLRSWCKTVCVKHQGH